MSEDMPVQEPESGLSVNPEAEVNEPAVPSDIDPEVLAQLEERLKEFKEGKGHTESGSEAVGPDLSEFELDPALEHLYKRGRVEDTPEGPKWVAAEHQYMIVSGNYSGDQGKVNKAGIYMRLDELITAIANGPEGIMSVPNHGWRLSAIIPNGSGMGVAILERNVKRVLPDPKIVEKKTEVSDVKDEELTRMNEAAQDWATGQSEPTADEIEGAQDAERGEDAGQ